MMPPASFVQSTGVAATRSPVSQRSPSPPPPPSPPAETMNSLPLSRLPDAPDAVDSKINAPFATAPDGYPALESELNVVADTVDLPPHEELSTDARLDFKDPDTNDIGWNKDMGHLPPAIVHGLSNEDLFLLIRRFNKASLLFYIRCTVGRRCGVLGWIYRVFE